jgi:hypothetical protein
VKRDYFISKQGGLTVQYVYHELVTGNLNKILVATQRELETNGWMTGMYYHGQGASL